MSEDNQEQGEPAAATQQQQQEEEHSEATETVAHAVDGVLAEVITEVSNIATSPLGSSGKKLRIYEIELMQRQKEKEEAEQRKKARQERKQRFIQTTDLLRKDRSPKKREGVSASLSPASHSGYDQELEAELQRAREIEARVAERQRERAERHRRKLLARQRMEDKLRQEEEEEQKRKQEEQERIAQERAEVVQRLREKRLQHQQQREQLRKQIKEEQAKLKQKEPPLYERREQEFKEKIIASELEKRKQFLSRVHEQFKPMDFQTLREYEIQTMTALQEAERQKQLERERSMPRHSVPQRYRGKTSEIVSQEMREQRDQQRKEREWKLALMNKQKRYAAMIKEMFPPSVDDMKRKEVEARIHQFPNPKAPRRLPTIEVRSAEKASPAGPRFAKSAEFGDISPRVAFSEEKPPHALVYDTPPAPPVELTANDENLAQLSETSAMYIDAIKQKLAQLEDDGPAQAPETEA